MGIVFDEILTEVPAPNVEGTQGDSEPREENASGGASVQADRELQLALERITLRQLRLKAD